MAILKNGINGPFSGKIGTAVGSSWRGVNIIRSRPKAQTHFSEKQLANQMKMKMAQEFLKHLVEPLRIGFRDDLIVPTAYNSAVGYNKKYAFTGEYPNLSIDLSAVKVAQGILQIPKDITMEADDAGIAITWSTNVVENARRDDQLLLVLWDEGTNVAQYSLQAYRSAEQFRWEPVFFAPGSHVWAAFIRQDRSMQSESKYLGVAV